MKIAKSITVKHLLMMGILCMSVSAFSQNGYVKQTIVDGDTTTAYLPDQMYWKLLQGLDDDILESTLNIYGNRVDIKYPVVSRVYDGYIKEYIVSGRDIDDFTIQFHSRDNTVVYVYSDKTIVYRGEHINFDL